MIRAFTFLVFGFLVSTCVIAGEDEFFEARIRPVLHDRCFGCHGVSEQHGGLRLDSRDAILKGGESGTALVPGKPDESLLLKAIRYEEEELKTRPENTNKTICV